MIRLLGAVAPPRPSADAGTRLGKASAAPASEACRRKPRRVGADADRRGRAERWGGGGMRREGKRGRTESQEEKRESPEARSLRPGTRIARRRSSGKGRTRPAGAHLRTRDKPGLPREANPTFSEGGWRQELRPHDDHWQGRRFRHRVSGRTPGADPHAPFPGSPKAPSSRCDARTTPGRPRTTPGTSPRAPSRMLAPRCVGVVRWRRGDLPMKPGKSPSLAPAFP